MKNGVMPTATTIWQAALLSGAMPLAIATSFVYAAVTVRWTPSEDWLWGLAALVPLEFVRAVVLETLSDAYKNYQAPRQAVHKFLVSIGSLVVVGIVWAMFNIGFGAPFALLANSRVQHLLGIPAIVLVAECAVTLYLFRGDAHGEAARIQAAADDAYDWIFLATFYVPPLLLLVAFLPLLKWNEAALEAWFDNPDRDVTILLPPLLFYGAAYFCGKAAMLSYVHTARFDRTGERMLGAGWIQRLLLRSTEERTKEISNVSYRKQALEHEFTPQKKMSESATRSI